MQSNAINFKFQVIMSQATHLYLDHPYEPSPTEPGLYWATRFTDTRKVFSFKPDELYDNIDLSRAGKPLTYEEVCGAGGRKCEKLLQKKRKNIIGKKFSSRHMTSKCRPIDIVDVDATSPHRIDVNQTS